ncbi:MAG: oligosaccharide flippase family protein [Bacteroidetes bacterium]|uniref:Oligosaccharide flippase family protein n=1 Tax=Candidatus Caccoplasma merdipullorum TaxID=2840718 RepID=A0A9D9H859_9BACT|nr:oligosaccharide flippase family protein [Candidatus Caccoplasma merdipullorum]
MTENKQIIRNSATGVMQFVVVAVLTFICVPVFMNNLGIEAYGIFSVVTVIGNLNFFSTFGLSNVLLIFLSSQGKCEESQKDIIVISSLMFVSAFIICSILLIFRNPIINYIIPSLPINTFNDTKVLYTSLVLANIFLMMGQVGVSIIDSCQKIYITNMLQFIYNLIYWIGLVITVSLGYGLRYIGIPLFSAAFIWSCLVFWQARKTWGKITLTTSLLPEIKRLVKKHLSYGLKVFISGFLGFLVEPLSKILLSVFFGQTYAAYYDIALKIKNHLISIFNKLLYPLFPYIAGAKPGERLNYIISDCSNKLLLGVLYISAICIFVFPVLVKYWLGIEYNSTVLLYITVISVSYMLLSPPMIPIYYYLQAKKQPEKNVYIHLLNVIFNLLTFFSLYKYLGAYAILVSNFMAYFASYVLGLIYMRIYVRYRVMQNIRFYIHTALWTILVIAISAVIKYFVPETIGDIIIYPAIITGLLIIFTRKGLLISPSEINMYIGCLPKIKNMVNSILFTKKQIYDAQA